MPIIFTEKDFKAMLKSQLKDEKTSLYKQVLIDRLKTTGGVDAKLVANNYNYDFDFSGGVEGQVQKKLFKDRSFIDEALSSGGYAGNIIHKLEEEFKNDVDLAWTFINAPGGFMPRNYWDFGSGVKSDKKITYTVLKCISNESKVNSYISKPLLEECNKYLQQDKKWKKQKVKGTEIDAVIYALFNLSLQDEKNQLKEVITPKKSSKKLTL